MASNLSLEDGTPTELMVGDTVCICKLQDRWEISFGRIQASSNNLHLLRPTPDNKIVIYTSKIDDARALLMLIRLLMGFEAVITREDSVYLCAKIISV